MLTICLKDSKRKISHRKLGMTFQTQKKQVFIENKTLLVGNAF